MSKVILGDKEESHRKRKGASAAGPHQNHEENRFSTLLGSPRLKHSVFLSQGFLSVSLLIFGALSQDREGPQVRPALFSFRSAAPRERCSSYSSSSALRFFALALGAILNITSQALLTTSAFQFAVFLLTQIVGRVLTLKL